MAFITQLLGYKFKLPMKCIWAIHFGNFLIKSPSNLYLILNMGSSKVFSCHGYVCWQGGEHVPGTEWTNCPTTRHLVVSGYWSSILVGTAYETVKTTNLLNSPVWRAIRALRGAPLGPHIRVP